MNKQTIMTPFWYWNWNIGLFMLQCLCLRTEGGTLIMTSLFPANDVRLECYPMDINQHTRSCTYVFDMNGVLTSKDPLWSADFFSSLIFHLTPQNEGSIHCTCVLVNTGMRERSVNTIQIAAIQYSLGVSTMNISQVGSPNVTMECPLVLGNLHNYLEPYEIRWQMVSDAEYIPLLTNNYVKSADGRNLTIPKSDVPFLGTEPLRFQCFLLLKRCNTTMCNPVEYGHTVFQLILKGYARCDQEIEIGDTYTTIFMVNTTIVPTCLSCLAANNVPAPSPTFFIGSLSTLFLSEISEIHFNADITQIGHQIYVTNFTSLHLLMDGQLNTFACLDSRARLFQRTVTTLNPIPPQLFGIVADVYVEGDTVQVICVNRNVALFWGDTFWVNDVNMPVGIGGFLQLNNISRGQAGLYTCDIDFIDPLIEVEIPTLSFNLVVHYGPDVTTNNGPLVLFYINSTLTLMFSFEGKPLPSLEWMHNGLPFSNNNESIYIMNTGGLSNGTSTLQWINASEDTVGKFTLVATNYLGSANRSFNVQIQSLCTVYLQGVTLSQFIDKTAIENIIEYNAFIEFLGTTDVTNFVCRLDGSNTISNCSSPVRYTLIKGKHELNIIPQGCMGDSQGKLIVDLSKD